MKPLLTAVTIAALFICGGCSAQRGGLPDFLHSGPWWQAAQSDVVADRAREWESRGELSLAMDHWRLVQRIAVDPTEAEREISRLDRRVDEAVRMHYQKGLLALRKRQRTTARNQFLSALRLNPAFQPALKQIRARYSTFPLAVYPAAAGDTPASVARKVFDDEKKAFLVAWFNHLPEERELPPGTLLLLPKLEKSPEKTIPRDQPPDHLAEARKRLAQNDLDAALMLARRADGDDPEVRTLIHTIQLKQARDQIASERLEAAALTLAAIPDAVEGKSTALEKLRDAWEQRQFDLDLAAARDQFERGDFEQSLTTCDRLLAKAPDNNDIRRLAAESRYRVAQAHVDGGRYLEARELLDKADESHEASAALKEAVRIRLVKLGQIHYRNGVKNFINEHLEAAIAEWEKTLVCNPDHAKARENIAIARRLLQKIETMP